MSGYIEGTGKLVEVKIVVSIARRRILAVDAETVTMLRMA